MYPKLGTSVLETVADCMQDSSNFGTILRPNACSKLP